MILTVQDSGKFVRVGRGETLTLRLAENPTTGYRWAVDSGGGLEQVNDRNEGGGGIGAGGVRVLEFRARRAGQHDLRLKHWREWEGEKSVIGVFQVRVMVEEG